MNRPASISRVLRTHQQAQTNYDRMSRWYDLLSGWSESKYKHRGLALLDVREGERVLEIGFGTGECLSQLALLTGEVVGVDLSRGMGRVALEKMRIANFANPAKIICADSLNLPFHEGSFDAIFMSFTLELFDTPEIPLVLNECQRVLQAGGRICAVSLAKGDGWMVRLYEQFHDWLPRVVDCRPIYPRQVIEASGLEVSRVEVMNMFGLPVEIVLANRSKIKAASTIKQ
jgi:demethylmenaquinone methyltransferase/2-methoxy-6-polyprenyl-1,4-benzoquinol methylase